MEPSMSVSAKVTSEMSQRKLFADYVSDRVFNGVRVMTDPKRDARLAELGRKTQTFVDTSAKQKSEAK
jgi:hypothetical protein